MSEAGKAKFAGKLSDILNKAKQAGVPVILGELVSNIRDQKPFIPLAGAGGRADSLFAAAQQAEANGDLQNAKKLYTLAKDYDGLRFRAPDDFNELIHKLAAEFKCPLAHTTEAISSLCDNGLAGNCFFLEHLHPTIDGYFALSESFFQALLGSKLFGPELTRARIQPLQKLREDWGVTELDLAYANYRIAFLKAGWPFKANAAPNQGTIEFAATTKAESLAVKTWQDKSYSREQAHVELAEFYAHRRDFQAAFCEYRALIFYGPQNQTAWIRAAEMLINDRTLNEAIPYLHGALRCGNSAFAHKWLGQIYLLKKQNRRALQHLEKAAGQSKNDAQLLYNLAGAYALNRKYRECLRTLDALDKIFPDYPEAIALRKQVEGRK